MMMDALTAAIAPPSALPGATQQAIPPRGDAADSGFSQALQQARQPAGGDGKARETPADEPARPRTAARAGRSSQVDSKVDRRDAAATVLAKGEHAPTESTDANATPVDGTVATASSADHAATPPVDTTALLQSQAPARATAPRQAQAGEADPDKPLAPPADGRPGRLAEAKVEAAQPRSTPADTQIRPADDATASPRHFGAALDTAMARPAGSDAGPMPAMPAFGTMPGAMHSTNTGTPSGASVPAEMPTRSVTPELASPGFAPALGSQVSLLLREGLHEARLQLNPAEMGPVVVQITLDGQAARVDFHAEHAATRQALESSLPALAGALHESGLTLAGGGVFQGQPGPRDGARDAQASPGATRSGPAEDDAAAPAAAATAPLRARRGLVDLLA